MTAHTYFIRGEIVKVPGDPWGDCGVPYTAEIEWDLRRPLPRVTTPVRRLNPDLWPDLKGDDL